MTCVMSAVQREQLKKMAKIFSMLPGSKVLLVDPSLLQLLDRVASMSTLRRFGVSKIFRVAELPPKEDVSRIAYMLPPCRSSVAVLTKHLEVDDENDIQRTRLVIFVPQETQDVHYLLESQGLNGRDMRVESLSLGWVMVDTDLVTLNLPMLYTDYYLHGDSTWPHQMGLEVGELLESSCKTGLSPLGCQVHAFGEAAEAVVAGIRLHCLRRGLATGTTGPKPRSSHNLMEMFCQGTSDHGSLSSSEPIFGGIHSIPIQNQTAPLVLIFSRDLDYVTPLLVPMTFEALIHETVGINFGVVELPTCDSGDKSLGRQFLNSEKMHFYKAVRDSHISCVYSALDDWRVKLQESRSGLEQELLIQQPYGDSPKSGTNVVHLKSVGAKVGSLVTKRRELSFLFNVVEEIMNSMTKRERVEDLRAAQTILLQSGSGDRLAINTVGSKPEVDEDAHTDTNLTSTPGYCGTAADKLTSMPFRLALEWMSSYHGDRLIDGIRMCALASVTHNGLGADLYEVFHRAVLHGVGQSAFPMLRALRSLQLVFPHVTTSQSLQNKATTEGATGGKLSTAAARLGLSQRRKSAYNSVHHLLRLSNVSQTKRRVDLPPVSPTYVYSGQHCPIIVRLAESIWASSLPRAKEQADPTGTDTELIPKKQLVCALKNMGLQSEVADSLCLKSFSDPSIAVAGYLNDTNEHGRRNNAPVAHPLPLMKVNQPVLVVFPGGCTYGEVAALRFVSKRRHWQLLIATSCLITSRDLLQQAGQVAINPS